MEQEPHKLPHNWVGLVVPAALLLGLLADGLARFAPLDHFSIRAWEAMSRNSFNEGGIPFEPSKHYESDRAYGDLAAFSNRHEQREYHRETFTADAFGYRNLDRFSKEHPPDAILIGTSFSVGCGVSDDQTLAVRLAAHTGQRIYNGAGAPPSPEQALTIARRFGLGHGTVLYELLGELGFPSDPPPPARWRQVCVDRLGLACLYLKGWMSVSPLEITSRQVYRWLENDVWLPNRLASDMKPELVGGIPMLFAIESEDCPGVSPQHARDYFQSFRDRLGPLDLFVILVPSKDVIYGPMIDPRPATLPGAVVGERCFGTISRALQATGINYIDLTDPLEAAAREALPRHELLYFRGDTHWNAAGIEVAAQKVAQAWSAASRSGTGARAGQRNR